MSILAKRSNSKLLASSLIGSFIKGMLLVACLLCSVTCSLAEVSLRPKAQMLSSGIDSRYYLSRLANSAGGVRKDTSDSVGISVYRNVLRKTLYSECSWYPSDSEYTSIEIRRCGFIKGFLQGFSRFMTEPNAAQMGYLTLNRNQHLAFIDLPDGGTCE